MATLHVYPRPTPAERADEEVDVQVEERLEDFASAIDDWANVELFHILTFT